MGKKIGKKKRENIEDMKTAVKKTQQDKNNVTILRERALFAARDQKDCRNGNKLVGCPVFISRLAGSAISVLRIILSYCEKISIASTNCCLNESLEIRAICITRFRRAFRWFVALHPVNSRLI